MEAMGLDTADKALAKTIAKRLINTLGQQRRRAAIIGIGKTKAARVWHLP